jgi:hypothetical protein
MSILQRGKYSNPSHVSTACVASEPSSETFKSATIALAKLSAIRGAAVLGDGHSRQTTGERQVERMDDEVRRNVVDAEISILGKVARRIPYEPHANRCISERLQIYCQNFSNSLPESYRKPFN